MGLFDDIFGSSKSGSSTTKTNQTTTGSSNVSTLDPATMAALEKLLPGITGAMNTTGDTNNMRTIAGQLDNTSGLNSLIDSGIAGAQANATMNWANTEGANTGVMEQEMGGGKGNTFAQLVAGNSDADLQGQLANIVAQSKEQEASLDTSARTAAGNLYGSANSGATSSLYSLISLLKGGSTNATSTSNVNGVTLGSQSETSDPGLVGGLTSLLALFGS